MKICWTIAVLATLFTVPVTCQGNDCPAPSFCYCYHNLINCSAHGLTEVPHFGKFPFDVWWLDLSANQLKSIPGNAFSNITGLYHLILDRNQIQTVDQNAFAGLEGSMFVLDLKNNGLTSLPPAVTSLLNLTTLYLEGNSFRSDVQNGSSWKGLSSTVSQVSIGSPDMPCWPMELRFLKNPRKLQVMDLSVQEISPEAFIDMTTLTDITFTHCNLTSLPLTFSLLNKLQTLTLDANPNLSVHGLPGEAFNGLQLQSLTITNAPWKTLPNIFPNVHTISYLTTEKTPLLDIPESIVPKENAISYVSLSDTMFDAFPVGITNMKQVTYLTISGSRLTNLTSANFRGMKQLKVVEISQARISYVTEDAFKDSPFLSNLDLTSNNLSTIPKCLKNILSLYSFGIYDNPIICDCTKLKWLSPVVTVKRINFFGQCSDKNKTDLNDFIYKVLPFC